MFVGMELVSDGANDLDWGTTGQFWKERVDLIRMVIAVSLNMSADMTDLAGLFIQMHVI